MKVDQARQAEEPRLRAADRPEGGKDPGSASKANLVRAGRSDNGRPGSGQGRLDVTEIMPPGIRVDPNTTEGHPGYEESGESEIIPPEMNNQELDRLSMPTAIASVVFGILGAAFWWWTPLGMVLSLRVSSWASSLGSLRHPGREPVLWQ
jgi:hypothetical protein